MPSEAYRRTRDALATLVSERAATRVLDAALRRASMRPDEVDEGAVRKLLLGPVLRELEGILPRAGLHRTLRRLARQVAESAPDRVTAGVPPPEAPSRAPGGGAQPYPGTRPPPPSPTVTPRDATPFGRAEPEATAPGATAPETNAPGRSAEATGREVGSVGGAPPEEGPGLSPGPVEALPPAPADGEDRRRHAAALAAVGTAGGRVDGAGAAPGPARRKASVTGATRRTTAPRPSEPTVVPRALAPEALDRLTVRFAEIDGVIQVIGLRDRDQPPQVRGQGLDVDALAPLARSAIRLLGRRGPLRSLVVEHARGRLFIFPLGRDAVAVLAGSNVNMGAVFAARAALEEA